MAKKAGFGNTRQLASGRWQARYMHPTLKAEIKGPQTYRTKRDAEDWLAEQRISVKGATWVNPAAGSVTLGTYGSDWIESRRTRSGEPLSARTKINYRGYLKTHLDPLSKVELRQLTRQSVREWHGALSGPDGPGASTAAKAYRFLRAVMNSAVDDELISINPCRLPSAGQEPAKERPALSDDDFVRIIAAIDDRWRALIVVAGLCGLRLGELGALRRRDIDAEAKTIVIRESASVGDDGKRTMKRPKTDAGRRTVSIPPAGLPFIERHLEHYALPGPDGLVFVGPRGKPVSGSNFGAKILRPLLNDLGLQDIHLHDLRSYSATRFAIGGATTRELMGRYGWAAPDMAIRYQRRLDEREAQLAEAVYVPDLPLVPELI